MSGQEIGGQALPLLGAGRDIARVLADISLEGLRNFDQFLVQGADALASFGVAIDAGTPEVEQDLAQQATAKRVLDLFGLQGGKNGVQLGIEG